MQKFQSRSARLGFTLIEITIVLAIAGVLFAGLYRLMSGSNQQLRDQSAANIQVQLISGIKAFLISGDGQSFMTSNGSCGSCGPNANFYLPLPSASNPAGSTGCSNDSNLTPYLTVSSQRITYCSTLPARLFSGDCQFIRPDFRADRQSGRHSGPARQHARRPDADNFFLHDRHQRRRGDS